MRSIILEMAKKVKTIDEKIEELAVITQRGFSDLESKMVKGFANVHEEIKEVKETVDRIEASPCLFVAYSK